MLNDIQKNEFLLLVTECSGGNWPWVTEIAFAHDCAVDVITDIFRIYGCSGVLPISEIKRIIRNKISIRFAGLRRERRRQIPVQDETIERIPDTSISPEQEAIENDVINYLKKGEKPKFQKFVDMVTDSAKPGEIAKELGISDFTVRSWRAKLYLKLDEIEDN